MAVACRDCSEQIVDNALFCDHCGATQHPELFRPTTVAEPAPEPVAADPWFLHALRFIGVGLLLLVAWMTFILGLIWRMHALSVTGYRKRDVVWLWLPFIGWVADARSLWRYTARDVYWTPRDDRPSHVIEGAARPLAITFGWLSLPIVAAGAAATWVDDDSRCVVDEVSEAMDAEGDFSFGALGTAIDDALERCDIDVDFGDPDPDPSPSP